LLGLTLLALSAILPGRAVPESALSSPIAGPTSPGTSATPLAPQEVALTPPPPILPAPRALALVFGASPVAGEDGVRWVLDAEGEDGLGFSAGQELVSRAVLLQPLQHEGEPTYLLVTSTAPPDHDCQVCAPAIGSATFVWAGEDWAVGLPHHYVDHLGSFGSAPDAEVIKLGPETPAVLFRHTYVHQGHGSKWFYLLTWLEGRLQKVLGLELARNNSGACDDVGRPCWGYDSTVTLVPGANPEYRDVHVATVGEILVGEELVGYSQEETYTFNGREYELVE
jgi:hypothetical protein